MISAREFLAHIHHCRIDALGFPTGDRRTDEEHPRRMRGVILYKMREKAATISSPSGHPVISDSVPIHDIAYDKINHWEVKLDCTVEM